MATTGKTGADTISSTLKHILRVYEMYGPKLIATAEIMHGLGLLTDADFAAVTAFFSALNAAYSAFAKIAAYAGFDPRT